MSNDNNHNIGLPRSESQHISQLSSTSARLRWSIKWWWKVYVSNARKDSIYLNNDVSGSIIEDPIGMKRHCNDYEFFCCPHTLVWAATLVLELAGGVYGGQP
jgi:hypothetical protein